MSTYWSRFTDLFDLRESFMSAFRLLPDSWTIFVDNVTCRQSFPDPGPLHNTIWLRNTENLI